jgi:predicted Zn finger-like uncharacterized protein
MVHMEVSCPNCYMSYDVSLEKIPEQGVTPTCKKCGFAFTIVKASGDPLKDRKKRMQGLVVVGERRKETPVNSTASASGEGLREKLASRALFEKKGLKLGVCIAGMVILLFSAGFYQWKHHVHKRFEAALRSALAHASNNRFALNFEEVKFAALGGLTRDHGCIYGLSLGDHAARERLILADEIHFELDSWKKHFITKPFSIHVSASGSSIALNNCVIEAQENTGWGVKFRVDQASSDAEGLNSFTARGLEAFLNFRGGDWKEDHRFLTGDVDLGFRVSQIQSSNRTVGKDVDILFSIENGLFVKDQYAADPSKGNYFDIFRTKWGDNRTVLSIDHCSFNMLGSSIQLAGQLEFHNPIVESELDLLVRAEDFSHIMKFIYRMNEETFNKIVLTIVALDEQQVNVYRQSTDLLDLSISYKNSKIKVNDREIRSPI